MRRLVTIAVIGALFLLSNAANAQVTFTLSPANTNTTQGTQVCLDVVVTDFTSIVSFQYSINYVGTVLEYDGVQNINLPGFIPANIGNPGGPTSGNLTFAFVANDVVLGETVADGTSIFQLCFTAIPVNGTSQVEFSGSPTPIEVTDPNGILNPVFNDATVIVGDGGGSGSTDLTFIASNETVASGASVCVDISVLNFTDIVSMQYSINYNSSVLQFTGAQGFNLPGMTAANLGNPTAGNITLSWQANDPVAGESVADGTVIFQLCFTAIGASGTSSNITFSGSPVPVEVISATGPVTPVWDHGVVSVSGGGGPGTLTFSASDETVASGDQVCVDISVQNFTSVVSMQYSINYNSSVLQFTGSQGYNLPGFNASSIGNPSAGNITISWVANDPVAGESVANGTVIFQLCFTAIGASGTSSSITFSGSPTPIEVIGASGPLAPAWDSGSVTVSGGGGPGVLTFIASDETAGNGDQVCVDISVQSFTNIVSMQYSINYDPSVLQFTGSQGYNLPGFTAANVGNPSAGNITISWLANDPVAGQSVANGTVIYQLCFTVLGATGSSSDITFSGSPTPVEVIDVDGPVAPVWNNGSVTVINIIGPDDFALILSDIIVESGDTLCIDLSVQNFTDMVSMQFSINYPGTLLYYLGAQGFNLPGLSGANFGNPGGPTSGNLTVSWIADDVVNGQDLADSTVIVQLCFVAIGPNCSTANVVFSGTPTPIEVTDVDGDVEFNWNGASVVICDVAPLALRASDEVVAPGSTACVKIRTVDGFTNITSMQFSVNYDPSIIDFTGMQNAIPSMSTVTVGNPVPGQLTIDWDSPSPAGTTIPDNTILFELCFEAVGVDGDVSPIDFADTPLPIQISNPNSSVPFIGNDGSVTLNGNCPAIVIEGVTTSSCAGSGTGTIDITVTGGNEIYSFEWSNGETSEDITGLSAGAYTVTVTSCGATASKSFTVNSLPAINITPAIVDVACFGESTGAIFLTVQGAGPFTYSWSGPGPITTPNEQNISNLIAGTFTVTVTDDNGCIKVSDFLVEQPALGLTASLLDVTPVSCFGASDGAILVQVLGGTPGYTYDWTPALPNMPDPSGIPAGIYNLQVVDVNSCTFEINGIEVPTPQPLAVNLVNLVNETGAGNNGSIDISVTGGTGPFSYFWTGPGGPYITQDITNLTSGTYCVLVTDANDCETTYCAEIIKPLFITVDQVNHPCAGEDDGSIFITLSGGVEPYAFFWTGPGGPYFTADIVGLGGGNYSLTVTDFVGTQASIQIVLNEPAQPLWISGTVIEPSGPNSCDGAVILNTVSGGTPPYTFYWSNTAVTPSITNLCNASYSVTVTDLYGCTLVDTFAVFFHPEPINLDLNTSLNVSCYGLEDGVWTVSIEGGLAPYLFTYSDGIIIPSQDGEVTRNDLPAGSYMVTITDSSVPPQSFVVTRNINTPQPVTLPGLLIYPATGTASNGAINITATGGTLPFSYQWNTGFTGPDPVNLDDACYDLTIADFKGCTYVFEDICVPRFEVSDFVTTDNFCESDADGSIEVSVNGGINEPLTYTWIGPNGLPVANPDSNQVSNLPPGNYTVYVTDALGVTTAAAVITVEFTSHVVAEASATSDFNGYAVNCPGDQNGSAEVVALDGEAPFTYLWLGGLGTGTEVDGLGVGTYYAVVTDDLGCKDTASVTLTAPPPVAFEADITGVGCSGESDGLISLKIFGTPGQLDYLWDDPNHQTTNPAIFLAGGIYTVTITNENECEQVASFEVDEPQVLQVILTSDPDDGTSIGNITAGVSGGTPPYSYQWNTGRPGDTGPTAYDLPAGEYSVMVTDANGCKTTVSGIIANSSIECLEFRNVITPDGDGLNEYFQINCLNLYRENHLQIFNRWGQLVFEADNYANDWSGLDRLGEELPEGAYFFVFEYFEDEGSVMKQMKGHITLIR